MERTDAKQAMKELTMALIYLSRFHYGHLPPDMQLYSAWKGYDFDVLDALTDEEYLIQGRNKSRCKSVNITDAGVEYAKSLLEKYGIDDWE